MSLYGLVLRLGGDRELALKLWRAHHRAYPDFWRWVQRTLDHADMRCLMTTMFGGRCMSSTTSTALTGRPG
jgi:hypothetical protein